MPSQIVTSGGAILQAEEGVHYGTAFPTTGLYAGRPFIRTDIDGGVQFWYDGTREKWLGELGVIGYGTITGTASGAYFYSAGASICSASNGPILLYDSTVIGFAFSATSSLTATLQVRRTSATVVSSHSISGTSYTQSTTDADVDAGQVLTVFNSGAGAAAVHSHIRVYYRRRAA